MELPNIEAAFELEAKDAVQSGVRNLENNWINKEVKVCHNCHGHKFDPEDMTVCIACDGTGADMVVEYGVEDGKFVSRVTQNGMEPLKAICAEYRQMERDKGLMGRAKQSMTKAYMLPESAHMELKFMYPDFERWENEGNQRSCANIVRKHYPEFMCTDLIF